MQFVEIDGCKSSVLPATQGVPQGSVLGLLLSMIDIYADDAILSTSVTERH